ncbi:hypothetical protein CDL15_Pgr027091 [Punica granatum]|nr:hypothetical protein CDL15_Pgr027091 [Punica granatum]
MTFGAISNIGVRGMSICETYSKESLPKLGSLNFMEVVLPVAMAIPLRSPMSSGTSDDLGGRGVLPPPQPKRIKGLEMGMGLSEPHW